MSSEFIMNVIHFWPSCLELPIENEMITWSDITRRSQLTKFLDEGNLYKEVNLAFMLGPQFQADRVKQAATCQAA